MVWMLEQKVSKYCILYKPRNEHISPEWVIYQTVENLKAYF